MAWLVAQTKPNAMQLATSNLYRQGFATFAPLERKTRRRQHKLVQTTAPYFGNYLFVSLTGSCAPISKIRSTYGIMRLVELGGDIARVSQKVIDELKSRCDQEGCLKLTSSVQIGDTVRMTGGPFHDQLGTVEQMASSDRLWVLLDILGDKNRTLVSKGDLALA